MSIFVSVASYRDTSCAETIQSLYAKADDKTRVYVGICQQNKDTDSDCLLSSIKNLSPEIIKNISILRLDYTQAKGPTYARYLCSTLYRNQDYYLQIDSHTSFVEGWDTKLINMYNDILNMGLSKKPVISHYPSEHTDYDSRDKSSDDVPRICKAFFNKQGILSLRGAEIIETEGEYYQTPYIAAGMFFTKGSFLKEVPFDPYLPYLFTGEEILLSMRFYTSGYDIFTPSENIVYHKYTREGEPKFWDDLKYSDDGSILRLKYFLGIIGINQVPQTLKHDLDLYGPGKNRSVADFFNFSKIDINEQRVRSNFCKENNEADLQDIEESKENFMHLELFCTTKSCRIKVFLLYSFLVIIFICIIILFIVMYKKF